MYFRIRENTFTSSNRGQSSTFICASHCSTCVAGARRKPEHIGGTKRGALVPRRQPSPRSVVFRRRPEGKVFRLVARQNPFTEGVLAAPPVPLKVKATDTAFHSSLKRQYRLPVLLFRGLGLRPYLLSRQLRPLLRPPPPECPPPPPEPPPVDVGIAVLVTVL